MQLSKETDISQIELSEIIFKDVASTTRMIQLLVKKGYLVRTENKLDRRRKKLVITDNGNKILEKSIPIILKNRRIATNGISEEELKTLSTLLNKMISNCT